MNKFARVTTVQIEVLEDSSGDNGIEIVYFEYQIKISLVWKL